MSAWQRFTAWVRPALEPGPPLFRVRRDSWPGRIIGALARETPEAAGGDDAYWAGVRSAVGRGTPSLLLGTSSRSLDRNLRQVREAGAETSTEGERP